MSAARPRLGRAVTALGLFTMLAAVGWGLTHDDLGTELLAGGVGFILCVMGRSLAGGAGSGGG